MPTQTVEHLIHQIVAGSVRKTVSGFIFDRQTRGLSPRTIEYYSYELRYFSDYLDQIGAQYMDDMTPDVNRHYLLDLGTRRIAAILVLADRLTARQLQPIRLHGNSSL